MKLDVTVEGKKYQVEIADINARPIVVTVDGKKIEVTPEMAAVVAKPAVSAAPAPSPMPIPAAMPVAAAVGGGTVIAPLPGQVDSVLVAVGDKVTQGQEVMKLEAMKMKNSIRSPKAGTVAKIFVTKGDKVKHGQPLIEIGD
ncbi:MAG TPA: biotin/lipoyl-binding protein [Bellilinea sp.]|nr:biotin/lipoyl-binding protein [Bellilinea sp.]